MEGVIRKPERLPSTRGPLSNDNGQKDRGSTTVSMQTTHSFEAQEQLLLLPGILDDITLDKIAPRLPWKTFHILSSVSRGWQQAIRNRVVYDARVRSQSRETLVLINHFRLGNCCGAIGLYSVRDRSFHQLPIISDHALGIPDSSQCISLDGKIYVLGGRTDVRNISITNKMYVLDLAGQRPWRQCAPMKYARRNFGCGILDGRIYVCGGLAYDGPVLVPEVYDPNLDSWFPITSMISKRLNHRVIALEHELLVYGGKIVDGRDDGAFGSFEFIFAHPNKCFFEIYNPAKDEWRKAESSLDFKEVVLMAEGQLHSMETGAIHVHDTVTNSWIKKHSLAPIEHYFDSVDYYYYTPVKWLAGLVVDNELVTILDSATPREQVLIQVTGLGTREREMEWEYPECSFKMGSRPFMCALQL